MLYFDHNATSPLCDPAKQAWLDATERYPGNPSSPHRAGARAEKALDGARERLAHFLACAPHEIVWTSGATESNNTVFHHFAQAPGEALISAIEHPSVLEAARRHFSGRLHLLPVSADGVTDLAALEESLRSARPAVVALMAANNETGILQPWHEALEICRGYEVPFFCDAAQWVGKMPGRGLGGCDFVSGCAHKFGGPQGVGFLKCPTKLRPLIAGGEQEDGRRAGTENVAGVLAMTAALEAREHAMHSDGLIELRREWQEQFIDELATELPGARVIGGDADRLWNTVSVIMPDVDCRQRWVVKLDKLGFAVSTGSACSSGREEPSHVLAAMGFTASESSRAIRFSSGWETEEGEWQAMAEGVVQARAEITERAP